MEREDQHRPDCSAIELADTDGTGCSQVGSICCQSEQNITLVSVPPSSDESKTTWNDIDDIMIGEAFDWLAASRVSDNSIYLVPITSVHERS